MLIPLLTSKEGCCKKNRFWKELEKIIFCHSTFSNGTKKKIPRLLTVWPMSKKSSQILINIFRIFQKQRNTQKKTLKKRARFLKKAGRCAKTIFLLLFSNTTSSSSVFYSLELNKFFLYCLARWLASWTSIFQIKNK